MKSMVIHGVASPMARVLAVLLVPAAVAVAAAERSKVAATEASLSQIRDTLRNLRRSIEDEGHDAENLYELRQRWCDDALQKFDEGGEASRTSLVHLSTDLKEHEAAVEEAEGTAQQIRADIALVQHTLNQTEATRKALPDGPPDASVQDTDRLLLSLVQNKKQTLLSLQGELQVVLPTLAQMQAQLAETQRRFVDRNESTAVQMSFVDELRRGCQASSKRADAKATARMGESSTIEAALQALDELAPAKPAPAAPDSAAPTPTDVSAPSEVSFVQMRQQTVTSDDLMGIFGGLSQEADAPPAAAPARAAASSLAQEPEPPLRARPPPGAEITQMISRLGAKSDNKDTTEWCAQERAQNHLVLRLAKASMGEMSAQIDAHADVEAQLAEEMTGIQEAVRAIQAATKEDAESVGRERAHLASGAKDQALATKILAQALAILGDLQSSSRLASRHAKAFGNAVGALKAAKVAFTSHTEVLDGMLREIAASAKAEDARSQESVRSLDHERANLELVRDSHESRRTRCLESKQVYEAQAAEASQYAETLDGECSPKLYAMESSEREVQIHALEDAQRVLEGREVVKESAAYLNLRGATQKAEQSSMSPMERAAAEMGVAVDDN
mmetsp:Transcript_29582/g.75325  ORF Transcript_29582/g.75325 Transcript_29582/m.75325 type:complete len:619 (-) Transcript_29582:63-1919(-)